MIDPPELSSRALLTEYEQLKEEQRSRIGFRDNLIYAGLIALAAAATATSTQGSVYLLRSRRCWAGPTS
jgi:hypothetical protein